MVNNWPLSHVTHCHLPQIFLQLQNLYKDDATGPCGTAKKLVGERDWSGHGPNRVVCASAIIYLALCRSPLLSLARFSPLFITFLFNAFLFFYIHHNLLQPFYSYSTCCACSHLHFSFCPAKIKKACLRFSGTNKSVKHTHTPQKCQNSKVKYTTQKKKKTINHSIDGGDPPRTPTAIWSGACPDVFRSA